jgi:chromosome segregation ATPase
LYRWLVEREENSQDKNSPRKIHDSSSSPREIISSIQSHLEGMPDDVHDITATKQQVRELESQLSVYRGDLKAREESSAELMASLKEAVALLKPLQDAAAKADRERNKLIDQLDKAQTSNEKNYEDIKRLKGELNDKDDEIEELKHKLQKLELELSKTKLDSANSLITNNRNIAIASSPESLSRAREDIRSKRQSETALKELLRDAQTRLNSLHDHNQQVEAMNSELQGRLRQAEETLDTQPTRSVDNDDAVGSPRRSTKVGLSDIDVREAKIKELEDEVDLLLTTIAEQKEKIGNLELEAHGAKENTRNFEGDAAEDGNLKKQLFAFEEDLAKAKKSLAKKKAAEKTLKRSLRDALALLKPLQMHLEESEEEKKELGEELSALRRQFGGDDFERDFSVKPKIKRDADVKQMRDLENTVKQLEQENSQLHDALEDVSRQSLNVSHVSSFSAKSPSQVKSMDGKVEARLREDLVQLKSRYEVTQIRLEDSIGENHSLVEELKQQDTERESTSKELMSLRDKLLHTERELENAKYIATSALVKVEELTMANVEKLSLNNSGFDHDRIYEEKAKELDYEMNMIRNELR